MSLFIHYVENNNEEPGWGSSFIDVYAPTQLVAPKAVMTAVATDAMICKMNLKVSFFVMVHLLLNRHYLGYATLSGSHWA